VKRFAQIESSAFKAFVKMLTDKCNIRKLEIAAKRTQTIDNCTGSAKIIGGNHAVCSGTDNQNVVHETGSLSCSRRTVAECTEKNMPRVANSADGGRAV